MRAMRKQKYLEDISPIIQILFVLLWFGGVMRGMAVLWNYQNAPGTAGAPPERWPVTSHMVQHQDRATLVMAIHPHCPCSRASLGELAILMTRLQGRLSAYILFYKPNEFKEAWEKTDLWQSASVIPDVTALSDTDGKEARRFAALTSGQTMVYDASGRLLFSGGITSSRGHMGDNPGLQAIITNVLQGIGVPSRFPVFGCSLVTPSTRLSWKN
jgi:hypothetical protein